MFSYVIYVYHFFQGHRSGTVLYGADGSIVMYLAQVRLTTLSPWYSAVRRMILQPDILRLTLKQVVCNVRVGYPRASARSIIRRREHGAIVCIVTVQCKA